jgi:phosphate/sulfate permease
MKRTLPQLFLATLLLLYTATAYAKCAGSGLDVWPAPGTSIRQNPVFILNGYAASMTVINGLNIKYPVYLKSGNQKIKLQVKEILIGQYRIAQAILIPRENLEAGKVYEMCIDSLPDNESIRMYNNTSNTRLKIQWQVTNGLDKDAPQWTQPPAYTNKTKNALGCGPAIAVNFSFGSNEAPAALMVLATVKDMVTGKKTDYYIVPAEGKITVGYGMCSGAFDFTDSRAYEVTFALMDASGNITPPCNPISFTAPTFADR